MLHRQLDEDLNYSAACQGVRSSTGVRRIQPGIIVRQQAPSVRAFRSCESGQNPGEIGERINLDQAATSDDRVDDRRPCGTDDAFRLISAATGLGSPERVVLTTTGQIVCGAESYDPDTSIYDADIGRFLRRLRADAESRWDVGGSTWPLGVLVASVGW